MKFSRYLFGIYLVISLLGSLLVAQQQPTSVSIAATVPRLVNFTGKTADAQGKAIAGIAGVTLAIYKEQYEGAPLWLETQNIQADSKGNYTVQLGATKPEGLPLDLFSSGDARWLGVTVNGGQEQPRVLLLSVPYALKAADAETVGGLPPSAFVLANKTQATGTSTRSALASTPAASKNNAPPASADITGKGTLDFVPMWDTTSDIINSLIFQKSSQIGINTTAPAATLDVNGKSDVRDTLTLFPKGTDSTLAVNGTAFKVDQTGKVTFVSGQTFPGTGSGTITGVTTAAGSGLTGGGTSGTLNLNLLSTCAANQILKWSGTAWACAADANSGGTVTSVGLSAPTTDFTVTGSPLTGSGTLGFNWTVAPTSLDMANAIVKRDAAGNFSAGNMSTVTLTASNPAGLAIVGTTGAPSGAIEGVNTGTSAGSDGVDGVTSSVFAAGVAGINNSGYGYGVYGSGGTGVYGVGTSIGVEAQATTYSGIAGLFRGYTEPSDSCCSGGLAIDAVGGNGNSIIGPDGGSGVNGVGGSGLGHAGAGGVFGGGFGSTGGNGIEAYAGSGYAGQFTGDVVIFGTLSASAKNFRIDHPLAPADKYLNHTSIESSEMLNLYTGNAILDADGSATVSLPAWFAALNQDFRYQLTAIGTPGPDLHIAEEIANNSFTIAGGHPGMKVSWQITGVRHDAYANAHPLIVEEEKGGEHGHYLHPELYGANREQGVGWGRNRGSHAGSAAKGIKQPSQP
jgi:hypothetical protein